ncbi:MAG: DUF4351 domain-containing protein [Acidobacteriota bacterium]
MELSYGQTLELKGEVVGIRKTLVRLFERRFGDLPTSARERVGSIEDRTKLEQLTDKLLEARSLADLGL